MTPTNRTFTPRRTTPNTVALDLSNIKGLSVQELHSNLTDDFNQCVNDGIINQNDLVCVNDSNNGTQWPSDINVTIVGTLTAAACKAGTGVAILNGKLNGYHVQKPIGNFAANSVVDDNGKTIVPAPAKTMQANSGSIGG